MKSNHFFQESRLVARLWLVWHALRNRLFQRHDIANSSKILIATQLLLGDCILIISLVQKARARYPHSEIVVALPYHAIDIYRVLNLGVTLVAWREKELRSLRLVRSLGAYDIAFVPYEKWGAVWANAFGANKVVGFSMPTIRWHDWFLTTAFPVSEHVVPVSDWVMQLISDTPPVRYQAPKIEKEATLQPRILLHIGARNANRRWLPNHWQALADLIRQRGWRVVWSYAPNERAWADQIIKNVQDEDVGGKLDFDGLFKLIASVDAVVCPDTGIVHLCKLTATPNVVIYGQGNPAIHGNGDYWRDSPVSNVFIEEVPCRDMSSIFNREIADLRRCDRGQDRCTNPYCQNNISAEQVLQALTDLLLQAKCQ